MKPILLAAPVVGLALTATATAAEPTTGHQIVTLPASAGAGDPIESRVLADTPHVKSVVIFLRKGAPLPEHSSTFAASIQALSGRGQVKVADKLEPISPTQMVLLDPNVPHEVIPDKGTDLVLLVQHMK